MPFAIGIEHTKTSVNVGTLLRSAFNFGASMVFTVGKRYNKQHSDTTKTPRHIPVLHFKDWDDFREHMPFGWIPVAVELCEGARSLPGFTHPKQAIYLLGPEDGSLSAEALAIAKHKIVIPSHYCLNVAVAGSVVMYDRQAKSEQQAHAG